MCKIVGHILKKNVNHLKRMHPVLDILNNNKANKYNKNLKRMHHVLDIPCYYAVGYQVITNISS